MHLTKHPPYVICFIVLMCIHLHRCILLDTGTPAGYLSDCPGMDRPGKLSLRGVSKLAVRVQRNNAYKSFMWKNKTDISDPLSGFGVADRITRSHILSPDAKTLVFLDGYLDYYRYPHVTVLMNTYDSLGYNFIGFDTLNIYARPYTDTVRLIEPVGNALADLLAHLYFNKVIKTETTELLGISLGGQQASAVGRYFLQKTGKKLYRITGLSPSGPCFRNLEEGKRLSANDAANVDVIHTNIDGLGNATPMGHVDFYMNGGEYMPLTGGGILLPCFDFCSHIHAFLYWLVALRNPNEFIGVQCASVAKARGGDCFDTEIRTNQIGPKTNFSRPGIYFLPTKAKFPYFQGKRFLKDKKVNINDFLKTVVKSSELIV